MKSETNPKFFQYEILVTSTGIILVSTIVLSGIGYTLGMLINNLFRGQFAPFFDHMLFLFVAMLLCYGIFTYLFGRLGYLKRVLTFEDISKSQLDSIYSNQEVASVTMLIPSYREEVNVIWKTLISAALQEYPARRVVLLIDNPPDTLLSSELGNLNAARQLPKKLEQLLARPKSKCFSAMDHFLHRQKKEPLNPAFECQMLAKQCRIIASWYEEQANAHQQMDYSDHFFVDMTFIKPAARFRDDATKWERLAKTAVGYQDCELFACEYKRFLNLFSVEITSFERKRYLNLSHHPSKASNLNSYLTLLGGSYRETPTHAGVLIAPTSPEDADFVIPAADFILMLDADTLISPDYTIRLVDFMSQPENEAIAVVQSPYSTFPHASHTPQRIAGAQTDIQYLLHQGLTYYDASYWVGANAIVRTAALRAIVTIEEERGFEVRKFIQDRTLIEDTESTIDLICNGWKLFNYPKKLAFSATPPDFGSLLIQRRRWANGGLLILPKLFCYARSAGVTLSIIAEIFMRAQYLVSLGPVSITVLFVVFFSVGKSLWAYWMFVIALLYYAFYMRDLHLSGYRRCDLFRVFALNMLLIPVNICGLCLSVYQACSGHKAQFGRTPKTTDRTPVPFGYVLVEFALLFTLFFLSVLDFNNGHYMHGGFLFVHAAALLYAIQAFLGFRNVFQDIATFWQRQRRVLSCKGSAGGGGG